VPAAERPLATWRVLVTRPEEQAAPFAEALSAAGATPIVYPTITLGPPPSWQPADDALARLDQYAWAIFSSPSAVAFTLGRLDARGIPRSTVALSRVRLAAVGAETARALRAGGLEVALVPPIDQQRQEGLLAALLAALPPIGGDAPPARILFPQALGGRELLRDELVTRGYAVDVVAVSQTVARDLSEPPPAFDVATFASPSALRAFVEGLGRDRLTRAQVAVIGPTTADAAAALGVRVDAMPPSPSVAALVQSLIDLHNRTFAPRQG
jgi:uroporphyrinogen-III synthase